MKMFERLFFPTCLVMSAAFFVLYTTRPFNCIQFQFHRYDASRWNACLKSCSTAHNFFSLATWKTAYSLDALRKHEKID